MQVTLKDLHNWLKTFGPVQNYTKLSTWRSLVVAVDNLKAICKLCDKKYGECSCTQNGKQLTANKWQYFAFGGIDRVLIRHLENWTFELKELETITPDRINDGRRPEHAKTLVKNVGEFVEWLKQNKIA